MALFWCVPGAAACSRRWRITSVPWTVFISGTVDFLNVLTVQNALLANEAALVDSTAQVSLSLVDLYGALGGGWQNL